MKSDTIAAIGTVIYVAVAFVAFGFACAKLGPGGIIVGLVGGAFWPASALIWLGVWIA